jgi:hypothetical protein
VTAEALLQIVRTSALGPHLRFARRHQKSQGGAERCRIADRAQVLADNGPLAGAWPGPAQMQQRRRELRNSSFATLRPTIPELPIRDRASIASELTEARASCAPLTALMSCPRFAEHRCPRSLGTEGAFGSYVRARDQVAHPVTGQTPVRLHQLRSPRLAAAPDVRGCTYTIGPR